MKDIILDLAFDVIDGKDHATILKQIELLVEK
jgi:hypothetical protein